MIIIKRVDNDNFHLENRIIYNCHPDRVNSNN